MARLSINYDVTNSDHNLSKSEQSAEAGRLRAKHLAGICTLLKCVDLRRELYGDNITQTKIDELSDSLNAVGELGGKIADSLFGDVWELELLHNEQVELLEDATTFAETEEINNAQ